LEFTNGYKNKMAYYEYLATLLAILSGLISAGLWVKSAISNVKPDNQPDAAGWVGASYIDSSGNDIARTLQEQSQWNKWTAITAAIAAISQLFQATFNNESQS
jgi:hypothetical protein